MAKTDEKSIGGTETPYDTLLKLVKGKFPGWINNGTSNNYPVTCPHDCEVNLWIRNNGFIVLKQGKGERPWDREKQDRWRNAKIKQLRQVRDLLATHGYNPRVQSVHVEGREDLGMNIVLENVLYDIPIGQSKLVHTIDEKDKVIQTHDLVDRIWIGFIPYSWDGRQ